MLNHYDYACASDLSNQNYVYSSRDILKCGKNLLFEILSGWLHEWVTKNPLEEPESLLFDNNNNNIKIKLKKAKISGEPSSFLLNQSRGISLLVN